MIPTYQAWIDENVPETYGKCADVTTAMVEAFDELRRVRGHHYDPIWGEREHWWCVAPDGTIVDPTAAQFPNNGLGPYSEIDEATHQEPTGMCPNCGDYIFDGGQCCSQSCHNQFVASLMGDW